MNAPAHSPTVTRRPYAHMSTFANKAPPFSPATGEQSIASSSEQQR